MYKSGSSDDKCIDSQHFGTCDSHTDFKVKSQSHGAGAYCGGHLAAQLVMDALQDTSEKYNMRINTKKTKIMRISMVQGRTMKISQRIESGKSETILLPRKFGDRRL